MGSPVAIDSGIYEIRNMVNGHRYIGSSGNLSRRKRQHFRELKNNIHGSSHLQNAFNVYGESNFIFTVLYECGINDLVRCEQEEVDLLKPEYNVRKVVDSNRGNRYTEEQKKRLSESHKGQIVSAEQREKIRQSLLGIPRSEDVKKKISEAQKGIPKSEESKRKMSESAKKRVASEETRRRIGEAQKGRTASSETRVRLSKATKDWCAKNTRVVSEETKRKTSESMKAYYAKRKGS